MSAAADRQRVYRARRAAGRVVLQTEHDEVDLAECLVAHGFVDAADADDPAHLAAGVERVISALIADHKSRYA